MASIASAQFLSYLKAVYPTRAGRANPWYIVAAVAFSASNRPQAVPIVFQHVLEEYNNSTHLERISVARKVRDALFKTGLVCGYSRAINALLELHKVTPDDLKDTEPQRDLDAPVQEYVKRGQACFKTLYGDTAPAVQNLLDSIYPDMGWFSNTIGYGLTYSFAGALTPVETSYALVAALITMDTPLQIGWHLDGAMRAGASFEEVKAVRRIAMEVAESVGLSWSEGVPEVKNLDESER
ncbi:hypothetical protein BD410DRAFT_791217 [Rickenella mellea]|uniref:Carboxymuconolactone decarboxylase-like domain-containing protein n=1 Tax=Rickenella mellea TaxID=50990 RepID=A0A4Y7PYN2_9AGAM|nr:hypothetical protein BD410DRAFT_791217 [Rickenella mellea]